MCLLILQLPLFAEKKAVTDIRQWFQENRSALLYLSYQTEIEAIFADVEKAELPQWILFDKLNEGIVKKVKGAVLVAALGSEYRQLLAIRSIFSELEMQFENQVMYEESLKTLSLYLSGGLDLELLQQLIKTGLLYQAAPRVVLQLSEAVLKVKQTTYLDNRQLILLADSLLNSTLPATGYISVSSLFVKGKIRHIQEETLLVLVTEILAKGGGLIQLNEELNRRIKK